MFILVSHQKYFILIKKSGAKIINRTTPQQQPADI
jgi:hypothetical protein